MKTMYATTPHNLANVFTLATVLLTPLMFRYRTARYPVIVLALGAAVAHPQTGIFAVLFAAGMSVATSAFWKNLPNALKTMSAFLYASFTAVMSPALFGAYATLQGKTLPAFATLFDELNRFIILFREPYYFSQKAVPLLFELLYLYRYAVIVLVIGLAIIALRFARERRLHLYLTFPILLLVNTFFLVTWLEFPELRLEEQLQYGERLLHVSLYFLLPLMILGGVHTIARLLRRAPIAAIPVFLFATVALTASLYFTYPQTNPKANFPGLNVTAADKAAATYLHDEVTSTPYVVLDILTAAPASRSTVYDVLRNRERHHVLLRHPLRQSARPTL